MMGISDSEGFGRWLKGQPPEFAYVLAARVALRVVPALRWALHEEAEDRRRSVILTSFRALAVASFAGAWPKRAAESRDTARNARREAGESVSEVVNVARMNEFDAKDAIPEMQEYVWRLEGDVRALGVAEDAVETILHALQGVVDAVDATNGIASPEAVFESCIGATISGCQAIRGIHGDSVLLDESVGDGDEEGPVPAYISEYWKAVERDAEFLQSVTKRGRGPEDGVVDLSGRALWPGAMPVWAGRTWADLKDALPHEEGWEVWIDWYEGWLIGRTPDEASEFERIMVRHEEWERGPRHLNALLWDMSGKRRVVSARTGQDVEATPPAKRYFAPDEPERSVTPAELKRLGKRMQIDYLVHWFLGMFEDPANETPYESRWSGRPPSHGVTMRQEDRTWCAVRGQGERPWTTLASSASTFRREVFRCTGPRRTGRRCFAGSFRVRRCWSSSRRSRRAWW